MSTPAGWYPDPHDATRLRYWDGTQWTEDSRAAATPPPPGSSAPGTASVPWWQSWPAIIVGFFLCFIPGLIALWARRGTSNTVKGWVTVGAALVLVLAVVFSPDEPDNTETVADPVATITPTPSTTETEASTVKVPAVEGRNVAAAQSALRQDGFSITVQRSPSGQPTGRVLQQTPRAGTRVDEGDEVILVVAAPLPRVPNVVGSSQKAATKSLEQAGFKVATRTQQTSSAKPGTVVQQSPSGGARLRPGARVTITLAKAPPKPPPSSQPSNCTPGYSPCLPPASDYDCAGGTGDGPKYTGPVRVTGSDPYDLDSDNDGYGCES